MIDMNVANVLPADEDHVLFERILLTPIDGDQDQGAHVSFPMVRSNAYILGDVSIIAKQFSLII